MDMDYYRLEDAAKATNLSETELRYMIETEQLPVALYSKKRPYIVIGAGAGSDELSCLGVTHYRGIVHPSKQMDIIDILESGEGIIKGVLSDKVIPADQITFKFPLSKQGAYYRIWKGEEGYPDAIRFYLIPLPVESETNSIPRTASELKETVRDPNGVFTPFLDVLASRYSGKPTYQYDYAKNGTFCRDDIRLTKKALIAKKLLASKATNYLTKQSLDTEEQLAWCSSKARHTQVDRVIERAYLSDPEVQVKVHWNAIKKDSRLPTRKYDSDHIITEVGDDCMYWLTKKGEEKPLSFRTFSNKLAELRRFYAQPAR